LEECPGGAASALYLLRQGITPLIVERETFPRFHIGESLSGEAGGILRDLGFGDPCGRPDTRRSTAWKVYGQKNEWFAPVMRRNEKNELEELPTWQVRRSVFDQMLLDEAVARGAELLPVAR
jgi:FADH2-dependent halogenase